MSYYLKQLLPLKYTSEYTEADNQKWRVEWRMWLGRCFNITARKEATEE